MSSEATVTEPNEQDTQFLAALDKRPIPVDTLLGTLRFLTANGQASQSENFLQAMQDTLIEAKDRDGLLRLLRYRLAGREAEKSFGNTCRELLLKVWKDRDAVSLLDTAGFGERAPVEAFLRLDILLACKPGALCTDKTWGFGVIKRLDAFYKKITVDFATKPAHQITFAHAAEALTFIPPEHLLARSHLDPAGVATLVKDQPEEIVRLALRSFGNMPVVRLEQVLTDNHIVKGADWKRFWDAARKALKNDPLVEIPTKRTESITLRAQSLDYSDAWMAVFAKERDLEKIVVGVEGWRETIGGTPSEIALAVLTDRLAFAAKGARNTDPALFAQIASLMVRTGVAARPPEEMRDHLWEQNRFLKAAEKLSARDCERMIAALIAEPDAPARLMAVLDQMCFNLLSETLAALREGPGLAVAQARSRELLLSPKAPPPLIVWVFRNREQLTAWPLPTLAELLSHAIILMEEPMTGEALRMQNTIHQMFENTKWFEGILGELDVAGRRALFDRIQASTSAWDSTTQRSLIGRMMRFDPTLAERRRTEVATTKSTERLTSWRSLRDHQLLYKQLIEVDLPKNSQDIATARSYGDLRENFEYHAAKHQQSLLLQRQSEMDQALKLVKGTDFANVPTNVVAPGVLVTITYGDGHVNRFCVLGEWDRDEALNIISCQSRMAQCLMGQKVGDTISVPGESGDEPVTIAAIEPLDDVIRAWISHQA